LSPYFFIFERGEKLRNLEIIDLYLEGFAKIHTGMHIDRLYLNFSELPNQTYLFVGDSGSGKSSILKSIHPFAFNNGTGDESASRDLIMNKRSGRKVIRYQLDRMLITCQHLYIRKPDDALQVKSYFQVNDEELNPSGLVTTFNELVQQYFYIDESFLTLLALGNSVRSMVEYTSGERKKMAVRIFTELNVYMTYYKNATAVVKELKTILSNVVDKLDRYGTYDKGDIRKEIKAINGIIQSLEDQLSSILKDEGAIKSNLELNQESYQTYESCQNSVRELLTRVDQLKTKRKMSGDLVTLENDRNRLDKNLMATELRIESLESNIKSELEFKEMKLASKNNLEDSLSRMENSTNQKELEKLLASIETELLGLEEIELVDGVDYTEKKEALIKASIYLDQLRGICTDLVTEVRNQDLVDEVVDRYLQNKHFEHEVDNAYKAALERITNLENANQISGSIKIPKIEYDCEKTDCPYKKFYLDSVDILTAKKDKADQILQHENERLHIAEDKRVIVYTVRHLYEYIGKHKDLLNSIPKEIFNPETFVHTFMGSSDRVIYDVNLMNTTIDYMEKAVRKSYLLTLQKTTQDQLAGIETTKGLYESMKVDLERANQIISETDENIERNQKDLAYNRNELDTINQSLKDLDTELSLVKELEDCRGEIREIQRQLATMEDCKKKFDDLSLKLSQIQQSEMQTRDELSSHRGRLNQLNNMLETINSLEKEKELLSNKYSEACLIKDAVSPSKGIPVEFIDDVIRNQMVDSINELMHVAYPDITIIKDPDKLIINDKEFTIPYKKNGVIVGDISEASDGERAMLSLAFSLVLIRLVSKVYNIMLLDEMDTALDKYGRSKYIDIIEQYMETISAKQIFLISHNSMFDMYDVNVLQTTKSTMDNVDGKTIVQVYEQNYTPDWLL
jgi:DNA repair exonuclease SbcCD ATPase subunit